MKLLPLVMLCAAPIANALDASCEPYMTAIEKTSQQPSRHAVSELDGGERTEAIIVDGKFYSLMDGKWRVMTMDLRAAERKMHADIRDGKIGLSNCKVLGSELVDGVTTTVMSYALTIPGMGADSAKAYIGKDGLIYAQSSSGVTVRYRYTQVTAPKL